MKLRVMTISSTDTYLLVIAITGSLHVLTKLFTTLRKSSCTMGRCCTYNTNNDDSLEDLESGHADDDRDGDRDDAVSVPRANTDPVPRASRTGRTRRNTD